MSGLVGGVVFPESVLSSSWFSLLAAVVAFNTIVYLGLTLSKLVPLPHQFHPSQVRRWLSFFGFSIKESAAMKDVPARRVVDSSDPYENLRLGVVRQDMPQAFALAGGFIILLSVVAFVSAPSGLLVGSLALLCSGLLFLALAQVLARVDVVNPRVFMWVWVVSCVVVVWVLVFDAVYLSSPFPLLYVFVLLVSFPSVTLAWRPTFVGSFVMLGSVLVGVWLVEGGEDFAVVAVSVVAVLVGWALLRLRLSALDTVADDRVMLASVASADGLTGALSRRGLLTLLPGVAGLASRVGEQVCVMVVSVDDLAVANSRYGVAYGDDVLCKVFESVSGCVRVGDLVARWDSSVFVVVGLGSLPDGDALAVRVSDAVEASGVNLGRSPTVLSVGVAAGVPGVVVFDELLAQAVAGLGDGSGVVSVS